MKLDAPFRAALPLSYGLLVLSSAACAERHDARGMVLKVDAARRTVTVSHDPIPNYMDAMAMPFTAARPEELKEVAPGDRIQFRLNVRRSGTTIDRVRILSAAPGSEGMPASAEAPPLAIGQEVPDFTLRDQDAAPVSLHSFRGRVVAVGFIYTRCPLPDYCPRVMTGLAGLRDRFSDRLGRDLQLLTITFDPQYDTPDKLKEYAQRYGADVPGWRLLTGSRQEVARVCSLFGVEYWPEEGMITHTLRTVVVDRSGRLAATVEGKEHSSRQLAELLESIVDSH